MSAVVSIGRPKAWKISSFLSDAHCACDVARGRGAEVSPGFVQAPITPQASRLAGRGLNRRPQLGRRERHVHGRGAHLVQRVRNRIGQGRQ